MTDKAPVTEAVYPKRAAAGRPKKEERMIKSKGRGRPKGVQAVLNDYRDMMLSSPKSRSVLHKVLDTALNDEHPHQASCMKMVMDRIVPAGALSSMAASSQGKQSVTINITGIGEDIKVVPDAIEGDYEEVEGDE